MLANVPITVTQSGKLSRDVHLPATFRHELLGFIADELPRWRDRADREPAQPAERDLPDLPESGALSYQLFSLP